MKFYALTDGTDGLVYDINFDYNASESRDSCDNSTNENVLVISKDQPFMNHVVWKVIRLCFSNTDKVVIV